MPGNTLLRDTVPYSHRRKIREVGQGGRVDLVGEENEEFGGKIGGGAGKEVRRGWIFWGKWRVCVGFVLSNILFIPFAYIFAKFLIPAPWQWMGFIICHHIMLAGGYEVAMDWRDAVVREIEGEAEVAKWDFVVRELEGVLERSRRERLVVEGVERVLRGGEVREGGGEGEEVKREERGRRYVGGL